MNFCWNPQRVREMNLKDRNLFLYLRLKQVYFCLEFLNSGKAKLFTIQRRSREVLKLLAAMSQHFDSSTPEMITTAYNEIERNARSLEVDSSYNVSIKMSLRRQEAIKKTGKFINSNYQSCPICCHDTSIRHMITTECRKTLCRNCCRRFNRLKESCPFCRGVDDTIVSFN